MLYQLSYTPKPAGARLRSAALPPMPNAPARGSPTRAAKAGARACTSGGPDAQLGLHARLRSHQLDAVVDLQGGGEARYALLGLFAQRQVLGVGLHA